MISVRLGVDNPYFEEVQEILDQLEHAYRNTAWDDHEIWFFYEVPDKKKALKSK